MPIRWRVIPSPSPRLPFANHSGVIAKFRPGRFRFAARKDRPKDQRLQISASATTAASSRPTKRIMMLPILCGGLRNGIGSLLSGRKLFMRVCPRIGCRVTATAPWSRSGPGRFKGAVLWPPRCLGANRDPAHQMRGGLSPACAPNQTKPPRSVKAARRRGSRTMPDQLLRSPSAARFHCETLSAIMRVDFIAAWLSWA